MAEHVTYYHIEEGRHAGIVLVMGNWPEGDSIRRGWTPEREIYKREATDAEHKLIRSAGRFKAWLYRSAGELFEDEVKNLDETTFDVLRKRIEERFTPQVTPQVTPEEELAA